jgi:hypothetical protein
MKQVLENCNAKLKCKYLPLLVYIRRCEVKQRSKTPKFLRSQRLGEDISDLIVSMNVLDLKLSIFLKFPDLVISNVDMFAALVKFGVHNQTNSGLIITP